MFPEKSCFCQRIYRHEHKAGYGKKHCHKAQNAERNSNPDRIFRLELNEYAKYKHGSHKVHDRRKYGKTFPHDHLCGRHRKMPVRLHVLALIKYVESGKYTLQEGHNEKYSYELRKGVRLF